MPPHFDIPGKTIGNRYHPDTVKAINADAKRLGVSQTIWMRFAVAMAIDAWITPEEMAAFQASGQDVKALAQM